MKKALKIIGIVLLSLLFIATIVLYAIFPTQTKDVLTNIWAILNTPLPIVGFTTLTILLFVYKVFIEDRYGKQAINNIERKYESKHNELKAEKDALEQERKENQEEIKEMKNCIIYLCSLIPNKKVNDLGDKFAKGLEYGNREETIDIETKAN